MVAAYLRTAVKGDPTFIGIKTLFTIHNLGYQGLFPKSALADIGIDPALFHPEGVEFFGKVSFMKAGIVYSDALSTVSKAYAHEIQTAEYGFGLDGLLRERHDRLVGILNGVDYDEWSTTNNPYLKHPFTARNLRGKAATKADLQRELGLPVNADIPLFGTISRLTA